MQICEPCEKSEEIHGIEYITNKYIYISTFRYIQHDGMDLKYDVICIYKSYMHICINLYFHLQVYICTNV